LTWKDLIDAVAVLTGHLHAAPHTPNFRVLSKNVALAKKTVPANTGKF
jgi:hypothetical protein